jgi:hypothetical protein
VRFCAILGTAINIQVFCENFSKRRFDEDNFSLSAVFHFPGQHIIFIAGNVVVICSLMRFKNVISAIRAVTAIARNLAKEVLSLNTIVFNDQIVKGF